MTIKLPVPYESTDQAEATAFAGDHASSERHTIFSPRAQSKFLEYLSENGNVRLACRAAGVSPQTAYRARRKSPHFAALWDAALLSARHHAEEVLADRALGGIEEAVFYHGEEVATRTRYSDRLLLAHLARLDRLAERAEVSAALAQLDDAVEALAKGEALREPPRIPAEDGTSCGNAIRPEAPACAGVQDHTAPRQAQDQRDFTDMDRVPGVPSCRNCGREEEQDPPFMKERLREMDLARPYGVKLPHELARDHPHIDAQAIEDIQLAAYEDGMEAWWLIVPTPEEWEA